MYQQQDGSRKSYLRGEVCSLDIGLEMIFDCGSCFIIMYTIICWCIPPRHLTKTLVFTDVCCYPCMYIVCTFILIIILILYLFIVLQV